MHKHLCICPHIHTLFELAHVSPGLKYWTTTWSFWTTTWLTSSKFPCLVHADLLFLMFSLHFISLLHFIENSIFLWDFEMWFSCFDIFLSSERRLSNYWSHSSSSKEGIAVSGLLDICRKLTFMVLLRFIIYWDWSL